MSATIIQRLMTATVLIHVCDYLLNMHVSANYVLALGDRLGHSCIYPFSHQSGNNQCLLNPSSVPGRFSRERGICGPVHIKVHLGGDKRTCYKSSLPEEIQVGVEKNVGNEQETVGGSA